MLAVDAPQVLLPVACRYVASDQWLTTQFDPTWKISQVKQYILEKVNGDEGADSDSLHGRHRPVSPITFAAVFPSRYSLDRSAESTYDDDPDFDSDTDVFPLDNTTPRSYRKQPSASSSTAVHAFTEVHAAPVATHRYTLLAFSTGQLLEDEYSLSWYNLRPNELLELHPPNAVVRLPREIMLEYIQPYFEVEVKALRVIVNEKDVLATKDKDGRSRTADGGKPKRKDGAEPRSPGDTRPGTSIRKRKKTKLEWRDRRLVIHHGMLDLYKHKSDITPVHSCPLGSLTTLRGAQDAVHAAGQTSSPYVVCAKFRNADVSPPSYIPAETPVAKEPAPSPTADAWLDPWSASTIAREPEDLTFSVWMRRGSKDDLQKARRGTSGSGELRSSGLGRDDGKKDGEIKAESFWHDLNDSDSTDGIWLILDMIDEGVQSNFLRILHRHASDTVSSTFIPGYLLPNAASPVLSPASSSSSSYLNDPHRPPYPYPEWRIDVAKRAHKSGLGNLGKAMGFIMWGGEGPESSAASSTAPTPARRAAPDTGDELIGNLDYDADADLDDSDLSDCEREWEGWMKDLARQSRAIRLHPNVTVSPAPSTAFPTADVRMPSSALSSAGASSSESFYRHPRDREPPAASSLGATPPSAPLMYLSAHQQLSEIHGGMEALSEDAPALLTTPSVMAMPPTGVTTSTVSVGGVIRARSLTAVDEHGRGRGVPRAMEVLPEGKQVKAKRRDERPRVGSAAGRGPLSPTATLMSVMSGAEERGGGSVRSAWDSVGQVETGVPEPEPAGTSTSVSASVIASVSGGEQRESRDKRSGRKFAKGFARAKTFSPERLVKGLDSALDFVDGRR